MGLESCAAASHFWLARESRRKKSASRITNCERSDPGRYSENVLRRNTSR